MGKGKRPIGLKTVFLRFLVVTGAAMAAAGVLWWLGIGILMNMGAVLPAYTAEKNVQTVLQTPEAGIPYYYKWAFFDADGELTARSADMSVQEAQTALQGRNAAHIPYTDYYASRVFEDGRMLILQYDYSVPYGSAWAQNHLPDFQISMFCLLILGWAGVAALFAHRYARLLEGDAQKLTEAVKAIEEERLDIPVAQNARVRELGGALAAIEHLRASLAQSLKKQWEMEQQRSREMAALAHDLKTPLTIIRGNAELLMEEEEMPEAQAIFRSAEHMYGYIERLRAMTMQEKAEDKKQKRDLAELSEDWKLMGQGLCAPKGLMFEAESAGGTCLVERERLSRAVFNLLDNAARLARSMVRLEVSRSDQEIRIAVEDDGPGFTKEALCRAGELFFTEEKERPRDGHSGLGLAFARQTAQQHGGYLVFENRKNGGASAIIVLPAAEKKRD